MLDSVGAIHKIIALQMAINRTAGQIFLTGQFFQFNLSLFTFGSKI